MLKRLHQHAVVAADLPTALADRIRLADALRRLGRADEAAALADAALQAVTVADPLDMERMEFGGLAVQALDAAGHSAAAEQALQAALRWINTTQTQVPPAFVVGFRQRTRSTGPCWRGLLLAPGQAFDFELDLDPAQAWRRRHARPP